MGTLQHFRPVCRSLPTSKEEVFQSLLRLSTCTLIRLCTFDSIEIAIEPGHASPELGSSLYSDNDDDDFIR